MSKSSNSGPTFATNASGNAFLDTSAADIPQRHLDMTVELYSDGHVKSAPLAAMAVPKQVFIPNIGGTCGGGNGLRTVYTAFTIQDD